MINEAGVNLIKGFEGLRLDSYLCPAGVWTIGYGHTLGVKRRQTITEHEALIFLYQDLEKFEAGVGRLVAVSLTENQRASLVSFSFNVGLHSLADSTLLKKLNAGDYESTANEFLRWNKGGGKVLAGLVKRRNDERNLFLS